MSLPNNITKFYIIRPGSFDPAKIINQYESGILQLQDLENIDTIMLQITLPNVVASELSILQIISGKYKLGIVAKNWLHNGIPTESASEVLELKGLSNPNQIIEMIKDLKNWEYIKEGKIKILGIYKSANIYIPNDRNAID